jgi:hypothetical protein
MQVFFFVGRTSKIFKRDKGKGKAVHVLYVPRREEVLGEWKYSSTHP